jgi:hypothetical protein
MRALARRLFRSRRLCRYRRTLRQLFKRGFPIDRGVILFCERALQQNLVDFRAV